MEKQLKPYDMFIVYVYIAMVVLGALSIAVSALSFLSGIAPLAGLIAFFYLMIEDAKQLSAIGKVAPSKYWALLAPVYLWKRANILGEPKKTAFWAFIGVMIASAIVNSIIVACVAPSIAV